MASFKVMMVMADGERAGNGLRFATREQAQGYGFDLLSRWTLPVDFEVVESEDAVNRGGDNG